MDRRSWLWRRKSSEKSPSGETESSGSLSSHSERFSDDQTPSNLNTQSPEVTCKAAPCDQQVLNESLKVLSEKLSQALLNIRAKEDLVNQHAKVAEEAVSGWERAENEVLGLKKQNDTLIQKTLVLDERVGHLDGALKECLRQLRQAREEQEEKIYDAVIRKNTEWESKKSELESEIAGLHTRLQNAETETNSNAMLADVLTRLEAAEKQNSILKLKLLSKAEELQLRTNERDLSIHAAETASKQHLASIKKVAKLEAECRRLKAVARKSTITSNYQSTTASSVYVELFTDSQSDSGERALLVENAIYNMGGVESLDSESCHPGSWASVLGVEQGQCLPERTVGKCVIVPSNEIGLMDDFLEMERLVALPESCSSDNPGERVDGGETLQDELEAMIKRTAELEDSLKKITSEKLNLEIVLKECQIQLQASEDQRKQTELELMDLKAQLALANEAHRDAQKEAERTTVKLETYTHLLEEAKANLIQIQDQLTSAYEAKSAVEVELKDATLRKQRAESKFKTVELELHTLNSSIHTLNKEVEKERKFSREAAAKCEELEANISRMKLDCHQQRSAMIDEFRINQDKEMAVAASKFTECQGTIASISRQLKSLPAFDDFLIDSDSEG